jgi:hypothetical protein
MWHAAALSGQYIDMTRWRGCVLTRWRLRDQVVDVDVQSKAVTVSLGSLSGGTVCPAWHTVIQGHLFFNRVELDLNS